MNHWKFELHFPLSSHAEYPGSTYHVGGMQRTNKLRGFERRTWSAWWRFMNTADLIFPIASSRSLIQWIYTGSFIAGKKHLKLGGKHSKAEISTIKKNDATKSSMPERQHSKREIQNVHHVQLGSSSW